MKINPAFTLKRLSLVAGFTVLLSATASIASAMESLDDATLSGQTGQDGITMDAMLPNSTLTLSQAGLIDTDGISGNNQLGTSFSTPAALVAAPATGSLAFLSLCSNTSGSCLPETHPVSLTLDAGSDTSSNSALNIGLQFPSSARRLLLQPFSLYMSPTQGTIFNAARSAVNANVDEIIKVTGGTNNEGLSIVVGAPATGDPAVAFNMQLGNEPQGHMFRITSGKLLRIGNDPSGDNPIQIMSKNSATPSSLKVDFELCATAAVTSSGCNVGSTDGLDLSGFYADISADSLIFANNSFGKLDIVFSNAVAGVAGQSDTNSFNGLKNGSMGSIGLVGVQVTNLQMTMRGM